MATISGGARVELVVEEEGSSIGRSGFRNRASSLEAWRLVGVVARARFRGRWERRSWDVGIDSGMFSDMFLRGCALALALALVLVLALVGYLFL